MLRTALEPLCGGQFILRGSVWDPGGSHYPKYT